MDERPTPDLETIERELDIYRQFLEAVAAGITPLPELPGKDRVPPGTISSFFALPLHTGIRLLGWIAKYLHLHALRAWAARCRIQFDAYAFEPASYGLNQAWTELGLARLAAGDIPGARKCFARSWQVYPGIQSMMKGLDDRLWKALQTVPGAQGDCTSYANIAQRFCLMGAWPRQQQTPLRRIQRILSWRWLRGRWRG